MKQVDWDTYARDYDLTSRFNPAYQQLVEQFRQEIATWQLGSGGVIVDLGAGTGNFSIELCRQFPDCHVIHIDSCPAMNRIAQAKANRLGLSNFVTLQEGASECQIGERTLAGLVSVHALYAFPDSQGSLERIAGWLQPGGRAFLCDVGRSASIVDWAGYLLGECRRRHGLRKTLSLLRPSINIARQNYRIVGMRQSGEYWTHTLGQFRVAVEATGLQVESAFTAYRGISDVVIVRKPRKAIAAAA